MKRRFTALLLASCFAAAPLVSCGDDSEKEISKLTKEIEELQNKCDKLESDLSDVKSDTDDVSERLDSKSDSIASLDEAYHEVNDVLSNLSKRIDKLETPSEDKGGGSNKNNDTEYTNNNGFISDSDNMTVAVPLRLNKVDNSLENSIVKDEEIAPEGDKIPKDYKPAQDAEYVMWLDISEKKDFVFNGETVTLTMNIKKDAPDGVYPIVINSDLSDVNGNPVRADKDISGSICINSDPEPFDADSTDDFVFYGDSVSCKPGDTVNFNINIANNPGLAAFALYMYYDSNAIEILYAEAAGEFEKINNKW